MIAYGRSRYQDIDERNCEMAQKLGEKIEASKEFRLLAPVRMNVTCFTSSRDVSIERVRDFLTRLRNDGHVFMTPTMYQGTAGIRAAFSNWSTEEKDLDIAWGKP